MHPCPTPRALLGRLLDGILPLQRRAHASAAKSTRCLVGALRKRSNRSRSSREMQNRCGLLSGHQAVQVTAVSCLTECAADVKVQPQRSRRHRNGLLDDVSPLVYAVGVVPCPGGQAACRGRQHSSLSRIADSSRSESTWFYGIRLRTLHCPRGLWASMRSSVFVFSQHTADVISKREYHEVAFTMAHRNASVLTLYRERLGE